MNNIQPLRQTLTRAQTFTEYVRRLLQTEWRRTIPEREKAYPPHRGMSTKIPIQN